MIKITSELKQNAGFTSTASVLEINSYTINETVQLTTVSTMAMPAMTGKNINVNFSLYKSFEDKQSGASAFTAVDFPYSISIKAEEDDIVDESFIYNKVKADLTQRGYNCEWLPSEEE